MSTLILELTGLLCMYKVMMLLISILSEQNIFQKRLEHFCGNKKIKTNICRIKAYDSIMCGHFFIEFIDFKLAERL